MEKKRLSEILQGMQKKKVLVLGDLMVDEYIWGKASRISPEAPVPVVEVGGQSLVLGGASNVAHNIHSLEGDVLLVGIVGADQIGENLKEELAKKGLKTEGLLVDDTRPTTLKTRVIAHNQQIVRIDREDKSPLSPEMESKVMDYLATKIDEVEALIVSDYGKGVITPVLSAQLIALARQKGKFIAVDPKGNDYSKYKGASLLTPNKKETETALNTFLDSEEKIVEGGRTLKDSLDLDSLLVTRGEEGMSLFTPQGDDLHIPAVASKVYDVTGAGDTVISTLVLALAAGASLPEATIISNYAAGVVVKKIGTSTVTRKEIKEIIKMGENDEQED